MEVRTRKGRPGKIKDEVGNTHGHLLVLSREGVNSAQQVTWRCKCLFNGPGCKGETVVAGATLRNGAVVSCGCYNRVASGERSYKHGLSKHPLLGSFKMMHKRCENPKHPHYSTYGGAGITVDRLWDSFDTFIEDMYPAWLNRREEVGEEVRLSIDRKKVNLGYFKDNCCWSTDKEQQNNKTNNHVITFNGVSKTAAQWGEENGISGPLIIGRIERCRWSVEDAITTPARKQAPHKKKIKPAST